jgi:hypothetical protein
MVEKFLFKPVCASGTIKYALIDESVDIEVHIEVFVQLPTVNYQGEQVDAHMCRNEYYLKKNPDTSITSWNDKWWFSAVNESGSQLNIFLKHEDNQTFLCAESTAAAVMVVRSLKPDAAIPMTSLYGEPYNTIKVTRGTTDTIRPSRES